MMRVWIGYADGDTETELTNRAEWALTSVEGVSSADVELDAQGVAGRDGSAVRSPRMSPRVITMSFALVNSVQSARRELLSWLEPKRKISLRFEDRKELRIDGYVQSIAVSQDEPVERMEARIYCPDPWFRGLEHDSGAQTGTYAFEADARGQGWRIEMTATQSTSALTITANGVTWRVPSLTVSGGGSNTVVLDTSVSPPQYTLNGSGYWVNWPIDQDLPELQASNTVTLSSSDWTFEVSYCEREWGF